MTRTTIRAYLPREPKAFEDFPLGPGVAVVKVQYKMFAILASNNELVSMNLKYDPTRHESFAKFSLLSLRANI
jgi:predicted DNA-binding protein (MmcQ/YjbR family)